MSLSFLSAEENLKWQGEIKNHLLCDVLSFWEDKVTDAENGGYNVDFDVRGKLLSQDKNIWLHARQVWMFSQIYINVQRHEKWLRLAKCGRDFIVQAAYASGGRWNYLLDKNRNVLSGTCAFFTDLFVLMALCSYADAAKFCGDYELINLTFEQIEKNLKNDCFKDMFPQGYEPGCINHGKYMIALNSLCFARNIIDAKRSDEAVKYCIQRIFTCFYKPKTDFIYELVACDGSFVNTVQGHTINPGHIFESMWFVLSQAKKIGLLQYEEKAVRIIKNTYMLSCDYKFGGILHMLDDANGKYKYVDWNRQRNLQWDDKVWWTHAEAICALIVAADIADDKSIFTQFAQVYNWSKNKFLDTTHKEWYAVLNREGLPRISDKGGLQKSAFHVPRALMNSLLVLQNKPLTP